MPQSKRQKAMMTRIKNKFGTYTWNPRSLRVNQVVKIRDLTGRHGNEIGTARVAITEATSSEDFKNKVNNPPIINGKPLGVIKKGEIINRTTKVVGV